MLYKRDLMRERRACVGWESPSAAVLSIEEEAIAVAFRPAICDPKLKPHDTRAMTLDEQVPCVSRFGAPAATLRSPSLCAGWFSRIGETIDNQKNNLIWFLTRDY